MIRLPVSYDTPAEVVAAVPSLIESIVATERVATLERAHLKSLGDSALVFECSLLFHTADFIAFMNAQQAINLKILHRFQEEKIRIAPPARAIRIESDPVEDPARIQLDPHAPGDHARARPRPEP